MDVVNDVTCTRQRVITRVGIRFLRHDVIIGVGGGGPGGARPPNNLGGGQHTHWPPPIIHPPFPSIFMCNGKKSQMYQVEG